MLPQRGGPIAVQVHVWPLPANADPLALLREHLEKRQAWQERLSRGEAAIEDDPLPLLPVLRIHNEGGAVLDLRTGLAERTAGRLLPFLVAALPLPPELYSDA
jgi:hypothetical protein